MSLYIMQHGKALSATENSDRPLSQEGFEETTSMAIRLAERGISVNQIIHSGKTRARQTAEIMRDVLNISQAAIVSDVLAPTADVELFAHTINPMANTLVVGHLPHLSKLISHLIVQDASKSIVDVRNSSIVALEFGEEGWSVSWMMIPE